MKNLFSFEPSFLKPFVFLGEFDEKSFFSVFYNQQSKSLPKASDNFKNEKILF